MRVTYRSRGVKEYWTARWDEIPADAPMTNVEAYPLKYAEMTLKNRPGKILEAGCGAGRILRHYHEAGYDIVGIDFIDVAIEKLKVIDPTLKVEVGDITDLHFANSSFKHVLAFGLYHNLERDLERAISETHRILEHGGLVCASFRADNISTKLTDWLTGWEVRKRHGRSRPRIFHKMNLTRSEFEQYFTRAGFIIDFISPVENMPILYKFALFRATSHKAFNETKARSEGYRLSWLGQRLQKLLMRFFPDQFCNIYVLIARKA